MLAVAGMQQRVFYVRSLETKAAAKQGEQSDASSMLHVWKVWSSCAVEVRAPAERWHGKPNILHGLSHDQELAQGPCDL